MTKSPVYLAIDLGAGSGRIIAGQRSGKDFIALEQVHRFKSPPYEQGGHLRWDFEELMRHIEDGLALAARQYGERIRSISVDTWGVDFALLDAAGNLLGDPICYRDARHAQGMQVVFDKVGESVLYERTGILPQPFNTLFQLAAEVGAADSRLAVARQLLFMPDLICMRLSGVARNERTIASTGALLNPKTGEWATDIIEKVGLDPKLFCPLVDAATVLGKVLPQVAARTGLPDSVRIVAGAAHDTASAVAAVPFSAPSEAFLSSGTWSVFGVELVAPLLGQEVSVAGFSNEGGVNGTTRLLVNVVGLWIFEECRKVWQAEGRPVDYGHLLARAQAAEPFAGAIDAVSSDWIAPGDMVNRLRKAIVAAGGEDTEDEGSLTRTIFESLAIAYARKLHELEHLLGQRLTAVRIVGGGSQNDLLNQMTADACGVPVIAGPVEATSLGNVLIQMVADDAVESIAAGRQAIAGDPTLRRFMPAVECAANWQRALAR